MSTSKHNTRLHTSAFEPSTGRSSSSTALKLVSHSCNCCTCRCRSRAFSGSAAVPLLRVVKAAAAVLAFVGMCVFVNAMVMHRCALTASLLPSCRSSSQIARYADACSVLNCMHALACKVARRRALAAHRVLFIVSQQQQQGQALGNQRLHRCGSCKGCW